MSHFLTPWRLVEGVADRSTASPTCTRGWAVVGLHGILSLLEAVARDICGQQSLLPVVIFRSWNTDGIPIAAVAYCYKQTVTTRPSV